MLPKIKLTMLSAALMLGTTAMAQEPGDAVSAGAPIHKATRQQTVTSAKNMVVKTRQATLYYLVSNDAFPRIEFGEGIIKLGPDEIARTDIKSIRFRELPHVVLDEDSVTFYRTSSFDHAAVAFRRTFDLGKWNSLVLPFNMTGNQLRYVFGDDAELAVPRAITMDGQTTLEFTTLDLETDEVVLKANYHYLLRPTREADVAENRTLSSFVSDKLYGPIYFIPDVSKAANQSAALQSVKSDDGTKQVRFHGTYYRLDGTLLSGRVVKNKKVAPGMYYLNNEGLMELAEDSIDMRAFRSWIQDLSETPTALRFYIDGIGEDITSGPTAIHSIPEDLGLKATESDNTIYTLSGQRLGEATPQRRSQLAKGIYVINGKKVAIK